MSAAKREEEGMQLLAEAEKKRTAKTSFFKSLFGSSSNAAEDAAQLFANAGNQFKLAKAWSKAGNAYLQAAEVYEETSDLKYEAASKYADAAKAFKNVDGAKAVSAYEDAIRLHTDAARFQQCARFSKEVAEIHEANGNVEAALESYATAADFYDGEDAKSNANTMRIKIATHCATLGQYERAADLFEEIAAVSLESRLLRFGAREHMLRAGLCRCLLDPIGAQRALDKYREMDSSFPESREEELLQSVVAALGEGDVEAFTNAVYKYDSISKLDEWKTSILLKIKNSIRDAEDDLT